MRHFIASVVFCLTSLFVYHGVVAAPKPEPMEKVQQITNKFVWKYNSDENSICTATYIGAGLFLTAGHCIVPGQLGSLVNSSDFTIEVDSAYRDSEADLGLLMTSIEGEGLEVFDFPATDRQLYAVGIPGSLGDDLVIVPVRISLFSMLGASYYANSIGSDIWPGMSGGPLLDSDGNIYGVISYTRAYSHGSMVREVGGYAILAATWLTKLSNDTE